MEIDLFNQTIVVVMFAINLGLIITALGFFGIQHQGLFTNIRDFVNDTNTNNIADRAHSDSLTRAELKNMTIQNDDLRADIIKNRGIDVRIHNDLSKLLPSAPQNRSVLLTDALFDDGGWGQAGYEAARRLNISAYDNIAVSDIEPTLRDFAKTHQTVIAQGFEWGPPALKVAKEFPNNRFVIFTGTVNSSNIVSINPVQREASYKLGELAALMTKTKSIGCVGGDVRYPNIVNILDGYREGARHINSNITVNCIYINDFQNPEKGRQAGLTLIDKYGADFLLHVADLSGRGVIQAAHERGVYAFGAVSDQSNLAPDTVIASFVIDFDKAYSQALNFTGGTTGLEPFKGAPGDGIVYLILSDKIPQDIKQKLMK